MWKVGLVEHVIRCDVQNLLQMRVTGFAEFFKFKKKVRRSGKINLPAELDVQDPWTAAASLPETSAADDLRANELEVLAHEGFDLLHEVDDVGLEQGAFEANEESDMEVDG